MSTYARYAQVVAVGTKADQIGQLRVRWPDVGEYPDWIDCAPAAALVMPAEGDFVEVRERDDQPGRYEWHGVQARAERLPAEVTAAHPQVAALLPPHRRCYLVLDDRSGSSGAIRLVTTGGGQVTIRNDGQQVEVTAPAAGGIVRIVGAAKVIHEAPIVEVGEGATEAMVKGTTFKGTYNAQTHSSPWGPTGGPIIPMDAVPGTDLASVGRVK